MEMRAGQRVVHSIYGAGVVLGVRDRGRVRVRFDGRALLPVTVPGSDLTPGSARAEPGNGRPARKGAAAARAPARAPAAPTSVPESPAAPASAAAADDDAPDDAFPADPPADPEEIPDLRQAVEALRLGVVPRGHVRDYTVARETEIADFEGLLDDGAGLRLVWGDYGTGKTHILDVFERMALAAGYVTSRVTLDPRETPPSHPQRLFREVVRSLRYPDDPDAGLHPLLSKLAESEDHRGWRGGRFSRILSPVLYAWSHPGTEAAAWAEDYIGGYRMDTAWGERELQRIGWRGPRPLALSDFRTYGRMYVHLVGTIAAWAEDAGHRGLVVLFDEVEYIDMVRGASRHLAREVLQHYAAAAMPGERLAFDPDELYRGGHSVHRAFPLRFADDQRLVVLMALTPLPEAEEVARRILSSREDDLELGVLRAKDFAELVRRVARLYARAHPGYAPAKATVARIEEAAREESVLGDPRPREVVRRTVLTLDAERLAGNPR